MNILVLGASRGTGRQTVAAALAKGHKVTALVRNPASAGSLGDGVNVVKGDVNDAASLAAAMPGHDAVIYAVGIDNATLRAAPDFFERTTENTLKAARAAGIKRVAVLSAFGAKESFDLLPWFVRAIIAPLTFKAGLMAHGRQEDVTRTATDLDWVIVRPTQLVDGPAKGKFEVITENKAAPMKITRADVGAFLVTSIESDTYVRKVAAIGG